MYRIASILVLCVLSASAVTFKSSEPVDPVLDKCGKAHNFDVESLRTLAKDSKFPDDRNTKCFSACLLKERDLLNADGTLNAEKVISGLPKNIDERETIEKDFRECAKEKDSDECETAFKINQCLRNKPAVVSMHPRAQPEIE